MTGTLAPTIPTIGQPNSTEDVDVKTSLETLRDGLNAILNSDNTVMGMNSYRTVQTAGQQLSIDLAAGTYLFSGAEGTSIIKNEAEVEGVRILPVFYFDDADYLITGKTLKMRLRAQMLINATKPLIKFTVGLYPVSSVAGGIDKLKITLGAVVAGSQVEFNEPAASTPAQGVTADFAVPADGYYVLGIVTSGTLTNNTSAYANAQLQVRNV